MYLNTCFSEIYQPLFEPDGRLNAQNCQLIFSRLLGGGDGNDKRGDDFQTISAGGCGSGLFFPASGDEPLGSR
jgi:hypothetical protein